MSVEEAIRLVMAAKTIPNPVYMLIGRPQAAMLRAAIEFQGRDWRRVKREMNKAWDKAKRS